MLLGRDDGITIFRPSMLQQQCDFTGRYAAHVYDGVRHCIQRERPRAVLDAILAAP